MIYEPILFPDIETVLVDALTPLVDAPVVTTVPADHPVTDDLVALSRVGGPADDLVIDRPSLLVEARSRNRRDALALLQQTRAQLAGMVGTVIHHYRESGGPAFFPDPDTKQPRYQMTVTVAVRGDALTGS